MEVLRNIIYRYLPATSIGIIDIVEIIILSVLIYHLLVWIKHTRAWVLMQGITVLIICVALIYLFQMNTLIFLINKCFDMAIIAAIVIFQPELRKVLEQLGEKNFLSSIFSLPFDSSKAVSERFSDKTVNELIRATFEMAKVKTGALIVIEQNVSLVEYERTGIEMDSLISSQLLINVFEHNTPLHDGAVIIRGDRIVSATCYLPLSDSTALSKALGTRHRAGVGISEVTDSLTIIVSEETGSVSVTQKGTIKRHLNEEQLRIELEKAQNKLVTPGKFRLWKGRGKHEKE